MKKIFNSVFILCSLLASSALVGACSSDDVKNLGNTNNVNDNDTPVLEDTLGNIARPTDWVVNDTLFYPSAMTFVINDTNVPACMDEQDLLAAFINDSCRSVTSPQSDATRFFLSVRCPQGREHDSNLKLVLRYYSAKRKIIYSSQEITFVDNGICGDLDEGYQPTWTVTSK